MGILERTKHVVRSDLNDLLKRSKNPEVVLDAYLDDLECVLAEAMSIRTAEEAERGIFASRLRDLTEAQKTWKQKAKSCLLRNDEELARTALERKLDLQEEVDGLTTEVEQRDQSIQILDESLETLKARINEVSRKRRELRFRRQILQARSELQNSLSRVGHEKDEPILAEAQDKLSVLEGRLEAEEDSRKDGLDDRVLRLEAAERRKKKEQQLDRELENLRRTLKRKKS